MCDNPSKTTYAMLDIAKFLCALLILFYHYFSEHRALPPLLDEALSLYAVAVALFMAISGFLAFNKIENVRGTKERWRYIKKQVFRLLKIYLLWSVIYIAFQLSQWQYSGISVYFVLGQIQKWVFGSTFYTIWFMPSLAFGLIVAFWVTEKLPKGVSYFLAVMLYAIGAFTLTYSFVVKAIPGFVTFSNFAQTWLGGSRGGLFFGFPLILVGKTMVYVKHKAKWLKTAVLSVIFMMLMLIEALALRYFAGHTGIDMTIMMIPACFCILGFLLSVKLPSSNLFVWMRRMSVLIFMTQRIFLTVLPAILPTEVTDFIFANNYVGAVFVCGSTILFSALIIAMSKRISWIKNLY